MKKLLVLISSVLVFSCSSNRIVTSKKSNNTYNNSVANKKTPSKKLVENQSVKVLSPTVNNTPINTTDKVALYIHKYNDIAQYEMQQSGIPASITLAQGILESGAGKGDLTKRANNHFGIKCHKKWEGQYVYHDDDERGECFRKYTYVETSYKDHSAFLTKRKRYAFLFEYNITDYKKWAKGLKKAGYATDIKYP